jgi:hypothetical protein
VSSGGMDYSEFEKLVKNFRGMVKDYHQFLNTFLLGEGNRCLADTKRNTPKDTGRLQNAWKLSGPFKRGDEKYVVIHNNVKYALWVEDGHVIKNQYGTYGWHPGVHMARTALIRTQLTMDKRFNRAFNKYCKMKGISK